MRGPLDWLNSKLGIWSTKNEKKQVLACLGVLLCWVGGIILPWFLLSPETFWQKLALLAGDVVWAGVTGVLGFFLCAFLIKLLED